MEDCLLKIGFWAGIAVPFFNIPLILRMIKRKSSADISLIWAVGVWVCFMLMLPSGLVSEDVNFKAFSIANITFFSVVVLVAIRYRIGKKNDRK